MDALPVTGMAVTVTLTPAMGIEGTIIPIPATDQVVSSTAVLPSGSAFTAEAVTVVAIMADTAVDIEAVTVAAMDIVAITTITTKKGYRAILENCPSFRNARLCCARTEPFFLRTREPVTGVNCRT